MMRRHGIRAIMTPPRRVRTTDSRHNLPIAPNLIARDFAAKARTGFGSPISPTSRPQRVALPAAVMDSSAEDRRLGHADHMQVELASGPDDGDPAATASGRIDPPLDRGVQYAHAPIATLSPTPHHSIDEPQG